MSRMRAGLVVAVAVLLAGCSNGPGGGHDDEVSVDSDGDPCGDVRGVVVDQAIVPIANASIRITGTDVNANTTSDDRGAFELPCLAPGSYFLEASHPLYAAAQQAFQVGGAGEPATVKVQLQRVIFATPYAQTQAFDGFVVCSVGFFEYASEECGEGVGVPCEVPMLGCQRVGGQGNNHAQWDFWLDGGFARTLVVDMVWESTSDTLKEFQLNIGNDWTCDPTCNGNGLNVTGGPSPLYATVDFDGLNLTSKDGDPVPFDADTRFSTFIWPNWGCANFGVSTDPDCLQQLNVAVNQQYQMFATAFYYLPAPPGWSLLTDEVPEY